MSENVALLLVDDRPENLIALEALLGGQGLDLVKATSGNDALRFTLRRNFALVLLDVQMPGMDGFETAELMRANPKTRHLPIIFVTAGMKDIRLQFKGYELGAVDYLIKPFEPHILQSKVKVFCELYRQRRELESNQRTLEERIRERVYQLNESEARRRAILHTAMDGFWLVDMQGRLLEVNETYCRMSGYSEQELLGMRITDIEASESAEETVDRMHMIKGKGEDRFQTRHRRKDGSIFDVEVAVQYRAVESGQLVAFLQDISERKKADETRVRLEAQLRESQKMEALGTLAGGVAHDFNNALAMILGNLELARQDVGPSHTALVSLEEIGKASRRAKDLVQQILAFGRRQKLERKPTSIALVAVETERLLRATIPAGVSLKVECMPDVPAVLADATQVKQVLLNLCANALHAVENQARPGVIGIRLTAHSEDGAAYRGAERRSRGERVGRREGRYACLTVSDNGSGMDEATRSRIFEPFFTTKPVGSGTGLGLSVVHGIAQAHDATIEVQSAPGNGSTVRIYFPATEVPVADAAAQVPSKTPVEGNGKRVLYIDDEEAIIFLMKRLLERQGFLFSGYTEPNEALVAARANPDQFDLVVTDYSMPGMSGLEVAETIREIRVDLPVVLASGYITEELRAKAPAAGVSELIYKPNTVDELCEAVARYANAQTAAGMPRPS